MGIFGGLISGALGIGQALVDRKTQQMNIDKTWSVNKQMADTEFQRNTDMWNRANEYNSPKEQMKRFAEAGLNPNLIYGQGTPGNATTLPKYQAPQANFNYKPLNLAPILGMYQDFTVRQAQIDNLREENKVLQAEAVIKNVNAKYAGWLNALKSRGILTDYQLKQVELGLKGIMSPEMEVTPYGAIQNYVPSPAYKEQFRLKPAQMELGLSRWSADINRIKVDTEFKQKQIEYMFYDRLSKLLPTFIPKRSISSIQRTIQHK